MIRTNQYPFRMDEFPETLITLEYKQFIKDHQTIPCKEIIQSPYVTTVFLENCYKNALNCVMKQTLKKNALLFNVYKNKCSDLSKYFPNEIILYIFQIYYKVNEQSNLNFKEFHCLERVEKSRFYHETFSHFKSMKEKKRKENFSDHERLNRLLHKFEFKDMIQTLEPTLYDYEYEI